MITIEHQQYQVIVHGPWRERSKPRYLTGQDKPNYPMPAIPLAVKYDYLGCVNIDDVSDPDDPIIVYMWDSWNQVNC